MAGKVEIDADVLQRQQGIVATLQRIAGDPNAKKLLQQAQKMAIPESVIPELDAHAAIAPELNEIKGALGKLNERLDNEAQERTRAAQAAQFQDGWDRQKSALRQQGFMDDFIAKIEDHASKEGIPNLRAAANDFLALNPPPAPASPSGFGGWDFFGNGSAADDKFVERMVEHRGDNDSILNAEIAAALADVRQQQPTRR